VLAGCAGGPGPAQPAPAAAPQQPAATTATSQAVVLKPSAAALQAAQNVKLTGTELGTMWTFENPPLNYWSQRYNFQASQQWLDHVRLSSVRYKNYCSASFVSPDGLVMTNHHCARECAEDVSTPQEDHVENGFYAPTRADEKLCPGLYLDQLVNIQDVTSTVQGAAPAGGSAKDVADAMDAEKDKLVDACETASDIHCQVVSLFHGGQYQLYKYHRYEPVKLVFVPELQAGFYGGDADNFTYPRFDLDVSFVRAYQPDSITPAKTPDYFAWNPDGANEGDLVFITGNPGTTSRQATVAQLLYEQKVRHPFLIQLFEAQQSFLQSVAQRSPAAERAVRNQLFGVENSLKLFRGEEGGLQDTLLMGRKIKWQRQFQDSVMANPDLKARYGTVWDTLAVIATGKAEAYPSLNLSNPQFLGIPQLALAQGLVRYVRQMALPEAQRDSAFMGSGADSIRQQLLSVQLPPAQAVSDLFASRVAMVRDWLPASDPMRQATLQSDEPPTHAAQRLLQNTRVDDQRFREGLLGGTPSDLAATTDPLVHLAAISDSVREAVQNRWNELTDAETVQEERLAKAMFAVFGTNLPPDATFTLRISDGVIKRYPYNGTYAAPFTTFHGLYGRSAGFSNEMPWTLAKKFQARADSVDMNKRLDFVSTNDITGGNSGSPIIDRDGRIVGIAFDGNVEQLPNEFVFSDKAGRTVGVDSQGITEALRSIYQAKELVAELMAGANPPN
jgi:hypothetical protein